MRTSLGQIVISAKLSNNTSMAVLIWHCFQSGICKGRTRSYLELKHFDHVITACFIFSDWDSRPFLQAAAGGIVASLVCCRCHVSFCTLICRHGFPVSQHHHRCHARFLRHILLVGITYRNRIFTVIIFFYYGDHLLWYCYLMCYLLGGKALGPWKPCVPFVASCACIPLQTFWNCNN